MFVYQPVVLLAKPWRVVFLFKPNQVVLFPKLNQVVFLPELNQVIFSPKPHQTATGDTYLLMYITGTLQCLCFGSSDSMSFLEMLTIDLFRGLDMSMFRNFCAWCQLKYEEKKKIPLLPLIFRVFAMTL